MLCIPNLRLEFLAEFGLMPLLLLFVKSRLSVGHLDVLSVVILSSPLLRVLMEFDTAVRSTSKTISRRQGLAIRCPSDVLSRLLILFSIFNHSSGFSLPLSSTAIKYTRVRVCGI